MSYSNGSSEASSFVDEAWASWFCNLSGNQFFVEIDKSYMEDSFNLFGLKQYLPKDFTKALDTILDRLTPSESETEEVSRSAALLYGLIHARYIITSHGLEAMHRKFIQKEFGECPRMLCRGQSVLPMGFTDDPKHGMVKLFCPKCQDVYSCAPGQRHIDGAFFGPTFPNLFFMTYEDLVPEPVAEQYVPRVFGFRIHHSSNSLPRAGSGGRAMGLYAGFAGRSGLGIGTSSSGMSGMGMAGGGSHFGVGHTHSFLTQNNLANNNNNGNHTSTSISESQSGAITKIVSGKRRHQHHHGYHTSGASDGHQSATPVAAACQQSQLNVGQDGTSRTGLTLGSGLGSSSSSSLNGGAMGLNGLTNINSSSNTTALTYTGLDGKIGIDIIDNMDAIRHQGVSGLGSHGLGTAVRLGLGVGSVGVGGGPPSVTARSDRERSRGERGAERESNERTRAERERQRSEREHELGVGIGSGGVGGIGGGGGGGAGVVVGGGGGGVGVEGGGGIAMDLGTDDNMKPESRGGSGASPVMGSSAVAPVILPPPSHQQRRVPLTSGPSFDNNTHGLFEHNEHNEDDSDSRNHLPTKRARPSNN